MLDIKYIKENPDAVKAGLKAKEVDCDAIVDKIIDLDVKIRGLKTSTESKTAQKNKIAKENGKLFGMKKGLEKQGKDTAEVPEMKFFSCRCLCCHRSRIRIECSSHILLDLWKIADKYSTRVPEFS